VAMQDYRTPNISHRFQSEIFAHRTFPFGSSRANEFFNAAVQELADEGVRIGFTITAGLPWAEIDDPLDLRSAQQNVFPQLAERVF
jgi:hypothetical protein